MYYAGDHHCDYRPCGKVVDPESRRAVFMPDGNEFCDSDCEENYETDRAAARADAIHDEAKS